MSNHPLCGALWLVTQTIERHRMDTEWRACGGHMLLRAGMANPQGTRDIHSVSAHHPSPINANITAQDNLLALMRALLILEGWSWKGAFFGLGGLTSFSPVPVVVSAHHMLPVLGRMDDHMARLGSTGRWDASFVDTLDNVAAFGAVAADPTFDISTYRMAKAV